MMTDIITGLDMQRAERYFSAVTRRLTEGDDRASSAGLDLEKISALDGVREYPSRVKCATLAWHALHSALTQHSSPVSTE